MAWNEPGNGNKGRDPWGSGNDSDRKDSDPKDDERAKGSSDPKPSDPWGKERKPGGQQKGGNADFDETIRKLKKAGQQLLDNLKGKPSSPSSQPPRNSLWIPAGAVVAAVVVWAGSGFYSVGQSQEAVVQRLGKYLETNEPGLHWNPTLVDRINLVNVAAIRNYADNTRLLTADNNLIDVRVVVQYQIGDARHYVFNVHDPEQTLRDALNASLNHAVGDSGLVNVLSPASEVSRFKQASAANSAVRKGSVGADGLPLISATPLVSDSLLNGREALAPLVKKELQASLDRYNAGLTIQSVNIERISLPSDVQESAQDVAEARQERQQAIENARAYGNTMQPLANGQAQQIIDMAKVYQNTVVARAHGETAQFLAQLQAYKVAPEVTRERLYLDTMSEIYHDHPKAFVSLDPHGHSIVNLPLDQLIGLASLQGNGSVNQGNTGDHKGSSEQQANSVNGNSDSDAASSNTDTAPSDTSNSSNGAAGTSNAAAEGNDDSGYVNVGSDSDSGSDNGPASGSDDTPSQSSDDSSGGNSSDAASDNDASDNGSSTGESSSNAVSSGTQSNPSSSNGSAQGEHS
ncbi:hypothetical protein LMG33818_000689 [Halomonadaceae bacterium LMG 33818]|uniref:SPFH domain-containing protein n=1 Tax=Cernens ardua TaxID=3402176 RepID=UPI003EDB88F9